MKLRRHTPALLRAIILLSTTGALAACGGGGGGGGSSSNTGSGITPTLSRPTWTAGQFTNEATFKDQCRTPRAGTSDSAGTTTLENFWLRSWSNNTYLWYDEITDLNPATYSDRLAYFETQKTTALTPSGAAKDKFHFSIPTDEYNQSVSSGAATGYGARFILISPSAPRDVRVAYVQPGSPADNAGIVRGSKIITIDGADVAFGDAAALNAGLFPDNDGEAHTLTFRNPGAAQDVTVTLTSAVVTRDPVLITDTVMTGGDTPQKIGYALFNTFGTASAEKALFDTFTDFQSQDIDELVLDLRYNGGGFLAISSQLGYMIAGGANTNGRVYERLRFNDKHPATNPVTGERITPAGFLTTAQNFSVAGGTPLPTLNLNRVYILSTDDTCSASESLINGLRGVNVDVVVMGTTTCGKPYGFYPTDNCGETYFTVQFVGVNEKGFGDYTDGFTPMTNGPSAGTPITGCFIGDDFSKPLGDETEALFSAALTHIETGDCPPVAVAAIGKARKSAQVSDPATSLLATPRMQRRRFLEQSRIAGRAPQ